MSRSYTQQIIDKLAAEGGNLIDRAEAAEARAAELEAQLSGAAQTIVTLTKERDLLKDERDNWFHALQNVDRYLCALADDKSITLKATHTETIAAIVAERDEWKATVENHNARLELARKDFMRRLSVVTHLWFTAKCERDKAQRMIEEQSKRIAELDATLKDIATAPYENQPNDGDEWEKEYYLRGLHR